MTDILQRICADKREHVAEQKRQRSPAEVEAAAATAAPTRGFAASLARAAGEAGIGLVAEIKKASPSKGVIREDFDPPALAKAYAAGGAACLSVLTDAPYFQGDDAFLVATRDACDLPVLRKDFMLDPYQIAEARALGTDCVLLIMAALEDVQARELCDAAHRLGMDVLVEVHSAAELARALPLQTRLVGINNRNLKTLNVDIATTEVLAPQVPKDRLIVAESGLATPEDLARMKACGVRAVLVGESLMRESDVEAATRRLLGPAVAGDSAR